MDYRNKRSFRKQKGNKTQRGGESTTSQSVQMPMQYYDPNYQSTYAATAPALEPSAYGPSHAVSHGIASCNNMVGPSLGPSPGTSGLQTGGMAQLYSKIVNPDTGRKVSIYSSVGKRVLKNYLKQF
jgi:hypothetical protein